jgi:tetratricopeptide (TPR) repeat protein
MLPKAKAALERAMEIDGELCEVQLLRGEIAVYFDFDWTAARRAFATAIAIAPGNDVARRKHAGYLNLVLRHDEAIEEARRAQELDPLSVVATHTLAFNMMCAGRYEEAVREFKQAIALNPTWLWGYIKLSMTYSLMGDHADAEIAKARADEILGDDPGSPLAQHWRARVELQAGNPQRMKDTLARLQEQAQSGYVDPVIFALVYHDLGELARAIDFVEQAWEERSPLCVYLPLDGGIFMDEISGDPRYRHVIEEMKFPTTPSS